MRALAAYSLAILILLGGTRVQVVQASETTTPRSFNPTRHMDQVIAQDTLITTSGAIYTGTFDGIQDNYVKFTEKGRSNQQYLPVRIVAEIRSPFEIHSFNAVIQADSNTKRSSTEYVTSTDVSQVEATRIQTLEKSPAIPLTDVERRQFIVDQFFASLKDAIIIGGYSGPSDSDNPSREGNLSIYISLRRILKPESILFVGKPNEMKHKYLTSSYLFILISDPDQSRSDYVNQFYISYGVKRIFESIQKLKPYHFWELGVSLGERYDRSGFSFKPGVLGALGLGTDINEFTLEGRIVFDTISMEITPIASLGYRF